MIFFHVMWWLRYPNRTVTNPLSWFLASILCYIIEAAVTNDFLNLTHAGIRPACAWFLRIASVSECLCVCLCSPPRLLITSGVIWTPYDWLNKFYDFYMWLDTGKPTELSHLAFSILLAQLIPTRIHYPCTVALIGLAEWSAFLELVFPAMWSHVWDNGAHGWHQMGGIGLIFTPC